MDNRRWIRKLHLSEQDADESYDSDAIFWLSDIILWQQSFFKISQWTYWSDLVKYGCKKNSDDSMNLMRLVFLHWSTLYIRACPENKKWKVNVSSLNSQSLSMQFSACFHRPTTFSANSHGDFKANSSIWSLTLTHIPTTSTQRGPEHVGNCAARDRTKGHRVVTDRIFVPFQLAWEDHYVLSGLALQLWSTCQKYLMSVHCCPQTPWRFPQQISYRF